MPRWVGEPKRKRCCRAWKLEQEANDVALLRDKDPQFLDLTDGRQKIAKNRATEARAAVACQSPASVMALANSFINGMVLCDPASAAGAQARAALWQEHQQRQRQQQQRQQQQQQQQAAPAVAAPQPAAAPVVIDITSDGKLGF